MLRFRTPCATEHYTLLLEQKQLLLSHKTAGLPD